jgi:DNA-binding MarR family transcriptional regulator
MAKTQEVSPDEEIKSQVTATLLRVLNKVQADSRAERTYGDRLALTMVEAEIIALITRGVTSGAEIAKELGVTHSAVSQVLRRLREKGFITSARNEDNARHKTLRLTPRGRSATKRIQEHYNVMAETLLSVPERDIICYLDFVTRLEQFLDANRAR